MITDSKGIYVHVPFCLKKCAYCDFSSYSSVGIDVRERYVKSLCNEILAYKGRNFFVDTVFFGGGTPSLLTPDEISLIFGAIRESFSLSPGAEISFEANPGTLDAEKIASYREVGVNRISIGCQSLCDGELLSLGRIHTSDDFYRAYSVVRDCGIDNVNVDLMYGIPHQTVDSFKNTLEKIIALSPEHISMYGLILEPGTAFWNQKDTLPLPSEDDECDMYYLAARRLAEAGYSHYEISNYSKAGYECRHNLKYWRCEEYIGVGLSAHSYLDGKRFFKPSSFDKYFSFFDAEYIVDEELEDNSREYEYVMMRLRLAEGISLSDYKLRFGKDFLSGREQKVELYKKLGYLLCDGERVALTERGFYVSNSILSEIL